MKTRIARLLTATVVALTTSAATAQPVPDDLYRAEVLPGWRTDRGTQMAALRLTFAPGWKTYWRAPGDAGIPPSFDWSGSSNLQSVTYHWPKPQVFHISGLRTLVYPDRLILPIEFTPGNAGQAMRVTATVNIGVCEEICVPVSFNINADLASGHEPDPAITTALTEGPADGYAQGMAKPRCSVETHPRRNASDDRYRAGGSGRRRFRRDRTRRRFHLGFAGRGAGRCWPFDPDH